MQRTKIHVLFFTTVLLVGAVGVFALAFFLQQNVTYEIKFQDNLNTKNVQINGLMKTYSLEPRNDGTIAEIEEYVMTKDAVEIALDVPKDISEYDSVIIEAEFENPDSPTLEACLREQQDIVLNEPVFDWTCHALDHQYLNHFQEYLGENWVSLSDEKLGLTLLQKTRDDEAGKAGKQYASVQEFLENPPEKKEEIREDFDAFGIPIRVVEKQSPIATIDAPLKEKAPSFSLSHSQEEKELVVGVPLGIASEDHSTKIPYTFRGDLDLTVSFHKEYDSEGLLEIRFLKQDMNRYEGSDLYEVKIYDDLNNIIFYELLPDDGIITAEAPEKNQQNDQEFLKRIALPEDGMYTVKIRYQGENSDSTIRNISVNMPTGINHFVSIDQEGYLGTDLITRPMTFYAPAGEITFKPLHDWSQQTIFINDAPFPLLQENEESFSLTQEKNTIQILKNDVSVNSEYPVSFSPHILFNTEAHIAVPIGVFQTLFEHPFSYILARYHPSEETSSGTQKNSVSFLLKNPEIREGKVFFSLRAPQISRYENSILIHKLTFRFIRDTE